MFFVHQKLQEIYDSSEEMRKKQAKVRSKIKKTKKELEKLEKHIRSLQKHLMYTYRKMDEAYDTVLKLKKQYGEEVYIMIISHSQTVNIFIA